MNDFQVAQQIQDEAERQKRLDRALSKLRERLERLRERWAAGDVSVLAAEGKLGDIEQGLRSLEAESRWNEEFQRAEVARSMKAVLEEIREKLEGRSGEEDS